MIKIVQPLNNNVVMGYEKKRGEIVVVGTGIGFHAKKGDVIDESRIQKVFTTENNEKLMELIGQIPPEYLELVEDIFLYAEKEFGILQEDQETLALVDHIHFAVKRLKEGMQLDNPFEAEVRQFYPNEWKTGLYAKQKIREKFNIEIPNAEVGYIAMHLIASGRNQDKRVVNKVLQVINISLNYIRKNYLTDVDEDSFAYSRLVTHVKYFAHRYVGNKETTDEDALLKKTIQEAFAEEMACIEGLSGLLYDKFGRHITDSEGNYLVLHLRNCKITDM